LTTARRPCARLKRAKQRSRWRAGVGHDSGLSLPFPRQMCYFLP
jgi:hypothetical protein